MTDLATLQAQLDEIRKIRASGVASIRHGETSSAFKTDPELAAAEASILSQMRALRNGRGVKYLYQSGKGL